MSGGEASAESELMPDWHRSAADEIDRIDWQPLVELGQARNLTPPRRRRRTHEKAFDANRDR
jgi:hypothetical protein